MQDERQAMGPIRLARERPFELGGVRVDPARRQISRGGRSETLEPRVMQVLVALAQARGQIIGRDDLIALCWDGRVVGDNAIHRAVSKVRDLGLTFADGAFQLETITKVGYRMVVGADDHAGWTVDAERSIDAAPERVQAPDGRRRVLLLAVGAAAVAGGGLTLWSRRPDSAAPVSALIARSEQMMRDGRPDADAQGVGFLEEAVGLEPDNALAWGRLALARALAAEYAPPDQAGAAVTATQYAAGRAMAVDRRQPDASAALALLPPYFGDWLAAERRMDAVLARHPDHMATRDARAFFHVAVGRAREGSLDRVAMAAREPLHAVHQFRLIYALWILGRQDEADRAAERASQLWPVHPGVWLARLFTLTFTGRADRALVHLRDSALRIPAPMHGAIHACLTALQSRRPDHVENARARLVEMVSQGPSHAINAVPMLSALDRIDDAFAVAEAYLLERGPLIAGLRWRPGQMSINDQRRRKTNMLFLPVTAGLRADARFGSLMDGIGLTAYWRRSGTTPDHLA